MDRKIVALAMAMSLSPLAAQTLWAAPVAASSKKSADKPVKVKTVSFSLRNDSAASVTVQAGDQQFTVEPGKTAAMKLAVGVQVIAVNGTTHIAAGSVVTQVNSTLQGNTLAIS